MTSDYTIGVISNLKHMKMKLVLHFWLLKFKILKRDLGGISFKMHLLKVAQIQPNKNRSFANQLVYWCKRNMLWLLKFFFYINYTFWTHFLNITLALWFFTVSANWADSVSKLDVRMLCVCTIAENLLSSGLATPCWRVYG